MRINYRYEKEYFSRYRTLQNLYAYFHCRDGIYVIFFTPHAKLFPLSMTFLAVWLKHFRNFFQLSMFFIADSEEVGRIKRDHGHGSTGPVHTFVKTDKHANFKWGVRHHVGHKYAGRR